MLTLILELIKSEGIAHHSYLIGDGGEGVVVDPRRDVDVYLDLAQDHDLEIKYVFETHRNEDYTIGSRELEDITGALIYHGSKLEFEYGMEVFDGDKFELGSLELEVLETPGHTPESISILLRDKSVSEDPYLIFTGDLIFAGELGRCDLLGESQVSWMAQLLYESIQEKILPLGDNVIICPAHGAGSVCGADIRDHDLSTIGYEQKTNPVLRMNKEQFIKFKLREKLYTPPYFKKMEENNQKGAEVLGVLPYLRPLKYPQIKEMMNKDAQIIDIRKPTSFGGGHIPHSLNIWREGLSGFVGYFVNYEDPIILVNDNEGQLDPMLRQLIRLAYDNIYGYLGGGFPKWYLAGQEVGKLDMWSVHQLKKVLDRKEDVFLLDVRKFNDYKKRRIAGAHHIWVGDIPERIKEVPQDKKVVVYCDSGHKSTTACSILKQNGYTNLSSVLGSMNAWLNADYPVVNGD